MVIIYLSPSCTSCRKAHAWLEEYNIPFIERNIMKDPPTKTELKKILSLTAKGTEEIISTRSKAFMRLDINIEDYSLEELYELIYHHRSGRGDPALRARGVVSPDGRPNRWGVRSGKSPGCRGSPRPAQASPEATGTYRARKSSCPVTLRSKSSPT